MRYLALCCDYDGTIAHHGVVDAPTIAALERAVESGRRLVLVTGRELDDLQRVMPRLDLFERIVAENGALLVTPATREERALGEPPPPGFVEALRRRGVAPLSAGRVIVATWEPNETAVLETIRELGLERQVIFNKGAVMVLPSGVNKASGLAAALDSLGLSPRNAVGVGDAENDHAFLAACELGVAVANALPALKSAADFVTAGDHGAGVAELVDALIADDLAARSAPVERHRIALGRGADGAGRWLPPWGAGVLVAGTSGSGKSTATTGLLERIGERGYSFCVVDPEGDYEGLPGAVALGTPERAPSLDEAMQLVAQGGNAVLNLVGLPLADRPAFFAALLPRLQARRAETGQPHWLVVDEAHHLLPAKGQPAPELGADERHGGLLMISVHPDLIAPRALGAIDTLIVVGEDPADNLRRFAAASGRPVAAPAETAPLDAGEALVWRGERGATERVRLIPARSERRRHNRKYAEGELPPDRSFWFRGPAGRLKLRAQNLIVFLQMADGVDDETWRWHLGRGDVSRWMREGIKDAALADAAARIEAEDLPADASRARMREAIEASYTLPG